MKNQHHRDLDAENGDSGAHSLDILSEDAVLYKQAVAAVTGRASKVLIKRGAIRVVLLAVTNGHKLDNHTAQGPCTLRGVRGLLRIGIGEKEIDLTSGNILALEAGVTHSVSAIDDGSLLLTVAMQ